MDLPIREPKLHGLVFLDLNNDGRYQKNEPRLDAKIKVYPGVCHHPNPRAVTSTRNGYYSIPSQKIKNSISGSASKKVCMTVLVTQNSGSAIVRYHRKFTTSITNSRYTNIPFKPATNRVTVTTPFKNVKLKVNGELIAPKYQNKWYRASTWLNIPPGKYSLYDPFGRVYRQIKVGNVGNSRSLERGYAVGLVDNSVEAGLVEGMVYFDTNGNGHFDFYEQGSGEITVTLRTAGSDGVINTLDDTEVVSTTTALDGSYQFVSVDAGIYAVNATLEDGDIGTTANSQVVNLDDLFGAVVDFGRIEANTIAGSLFVDRNLNHRHDDRDDGLNGFPVTLYAAGADNTFGTHDDTVISTTTTLEYGEYAFFSVPTGSYRVVPDKIDGLNLVSSDGVLVTIDDSQPALATFAYGLTDSIAGSVFDDANRNGIRDTDENGYEAVTVSLKDAGDDGLLGTADDTIITSTETSNGYYNFETVVAGEYLIEREMMSDIFDLSPSAVAVSMPISGTVLVDFATSLGNLIDGIVYHDENGDRLQNGGEQGLTGVTLTLFTAGADALLGTQDDETIITTTTNSNIMTHLTVQHTITHSNDFFAAAIDDEIVMINIEHGMYYRLNGVGSIIWEQLAKPKKIDDLCAHLVSHSNVAQEQCEQDVLEFLGELLDYGMLEVSYSLH